jgi:hypothetical protein
MNFDFGAASDEELVDLQIPFTATWFLGDTTGPLAGDFIQHLQVHDSHCSCWVSGADTACDNVRGVEAVPVPVTR